MTKMEVSNSTEQTTLIVTLINGPSFQTLIRLFSKRDVGKLNCTMVWEVDFIHLEDCITRSGIIRWEN